MSGLPLAGSSPETSTPASRGRLLVGLGLGAVAVAVFVLGLLAVADRDASQPLPEGLARLPAVHATLNGASAAFLAAGWLAIRSRRIRTHVACMLTAATITTTFLASYVYYHAYAGSVPFQGRGVWRVVYFGVLISHAALAAWVVPMAVWAIALAARGHRERHRALARWTLPLWLWVSVSGVLVYLMLYVWFPR